jgi:hypothetical protein
MSSTKRSRQNENGEKNTAPKKKRNTAEKIAEAYSFDLDDVKDVELHNKKKFEMKRPLLRRQIRETRWMHGHLILDQEKEKKEGKKHFLIETHYNWDHTVKFPNQSLLSLLSMWVFAIISVYDKDTNTFLRKNVTVRVGKEFSEKYYNHIGFRTTEDNSEVFDENDLINFIIQNPSMWL